MKRLLATLALLLLATAVQAEALPREELTVQTQAGALHRFNVEVAATPETRAEGLMFREELPEDAGMLFIYASPGPVGFWMKNTPLPLDMLFIDRSGEILAIHANAVPYSEDVIYAEMPVKSVLEINGGRAAALGIQPGDRVSSPSLQ